jgi:hypothetical protein
MSDYLLGILAREAVDTGPYAPARNAIATINPVLQHWGNGYLRDVSPSGSFAKGTANRSGTDIDLFLSVASHTPDTLKELYNSLDNALKQAGYTTRRQNVSLNIRVKPIVGGMYDVDLVPAKQQNPGSSDHSLYRRKADTWTKTNVATHIATVRSAGKQQETRIVKLWRNQKGLDFPSFYLELAVIEALRNTYLSTLGERVIQVFRYLRDNLQSARFVDPANTNNIISDDLTAAEKAAVSTAADRAIQVPTWQEVVK